MSKTIRKVEMFLLVIFGSIITADVSQAQTIDTFMCNSDAYSVVTPIPTTGTVKVVAIYACGSNASTDSLPDWWAQVWDTSSTQQHTIPRFYKDNSMGQYTMIPTPYGRDAGHCFKANVSYGGFGDTTFFISIMTQADAAINFATFDGNNDDTVDAFFLVVVNHGGSAGRNGGFGWITNDISANGKNVIIASNRSTRNVIGNESRAILEWPRFG